MGSITPTYKILEKISEVYKTNILASSKTQEEELKTKLKRIENSISEIKTLLNLDIEHTNTYLE